MKCRNCGRINSIYARPCGQSCDCISLTKFTEKHLTKHNQKHLRSMFDYCLRNDRDECDAGFKRYQFDFDKKTGSVTTFTKHMYVYKKESFSWDIKEAAV